MFLFRSVSLGLSLNEIQMPVLAASRVVEVVVVFVVASDSKDRVSHFLEGCTI